MWVVIHLVQNIEDAEAIRGYLEDKSILCQIRPVYKNMPSEDNCYEVLVIQSEAQEAYNIIIDKGY